VRRAWSALSSVKQRGTAGSHVGPLRWMKGRERFSAKEATEIRRLLRLVRQADSGAPQKMLRDKLRAIGFYISDFGGTAFTASDFDELIRTGRVEVDEDPAATAALRRATIAGDRPRRARGLGGKPAPSATTARDVEVWVASALVWVASALAALACEPLAIKRAIAGAVPDKPGLYALYGSARTWKQLGLGMPPDDRPLYVGKAEASLVSRDLRTHFATGATGSVVAAPIIRSAARARGCPRSRRDPAQGG
jgi:hypothetical protein